jgi:hypothetical protein
LPSAISYLRIPLQEGKNKVVLWKFKTF